MNIIKYRNYKEIICVDNIKIIFFNKSFQRNQTYQLFTIKRRDHLTATYYHKELS